MNSTRTPNAMLSVLIAYAGATSFAAEIGPHGGLEVELRAHLTGKSIFHRNPVVVRFTNTFNRTIRILRPLDGSTWCWHFPHYKFVVHDASGTQLKIGERCGNSGLWANIEWPKDYIIQILPGDTYEMILGVPHSIAEPGKYTLAFEYFHKSPDKDGKGIEYPEGIWEGRAKARPLTVELKP